MITQQRMYMIQAINRKLEFLYDHELEAVNELLRQMLLSERTNKNG